MCFLYFLAKSPDFSGGPEQRPLFFHVNLKLHDFSAPRKSKLVDNRDKIRYDKRQERSDAPWLSVIGSTPFGAESVSRRRSLLSSFR
jgi:hypothetical protein